MAEGLHGPSITNVSTPHVPGARAVTVTDVDMMVLRAQIAA